MGRHDEIEGVLVHCDRDVLVVGAGAGPYDEIAGAPFQRARLGGVCSLLRVVVVALEALALAPCVGLVIVFALGVELAVVGETFAPLYDSLRLLVRMLPDHMSCLCCRDLCLIDVVALEGEFDRENNPMSQEVIPHVLLVLDLLYNDVRHSRIPRL